MKDANIEQFKKLVENPHWKEQMAGKHVGLVGGQMVTSGSKEEVQCELNRRYPGRQAHIAEVANQ